MSTKSQETRRDRKRAQTRDQLARVARKLFERDGFDAVTMEQIAMDGDVAKGTLYNHFPTKEAVLAYSIHAELEMGLGPLSQEVLENPSFYPGVSLLMDALATWSVAHRDLMSPYLRFRFAEIQADAMTSRDRDASGDLVEVYARLIQNSQRAGAFRTDLTARHLAVLFHHLCLAALLRWLTEADLELREELEAAVELFISGALLSSRTTKRPGRSA